MMLDKTQEEKIRTGLLQLGLSYKEARAYLSALQNPQSTILTISRDTRMSRGTVYDEVEKLKIKGYLTETKKGARRIITVENPTNKLYSLLDEKHQSLEKAKNIVGDILPVIKIIGATSAKNTPKIMVYSGEKGFKTVWDDIFACAEKTFLSIARIETFVKFAGEKYLDELQKKKVKSSFHSQAINEDTELARKLKEEDSKYGRETRLLPKEYSFPSTEIIYGNKIAMFSTVEENLILVIESADFAKTHHVYFDIMWKFLGEQ